MKFALLLNQSYEPLSFISERRAIKLVTKDKVDIVSSWDGVRLSVLHKTLSPAVLRMRYYVKRYFKPPRFSRTMLFNRDGWRCQYCGIELDRNTATVDHVHPRALGGRTSWQNCVTSCFACNKNKGDRTLEDADMKCAKRPVVPMNCSCMRQYDSRVWHPEWDTYIVE